MHCLHLQTIALMKPGSKNVTIIDIARELGLSGSTVSRALIDHADVKEETKERVRRLAKKLGYYPNPHAQSLKNNQTKTVGVIVPEIKHDFFASAISGIEEVAFHSGYTILLCQSNERVEREIDHASMLMNHRVAGVLAPIAQTTGSGAHFQDLLNRKIPVVFFDRACEDIDASRVIIDDHRSARDAVGHLLERGYRRIAHFAGPQELAICRERRTGYLDALKGAGVPPDTTLIRYGGMHEPDGYASMDALIREENIPDAIFAVNDPVVIGAYQRIKEAGLQIPRDVAIVGFSNNHITTLVDPPITTVDQPSFHLGRRAMELLVEMIRNHRVDGERQTVVLEAKLIVRDST